MPIELFLSAALLYEDFKGTQYEKINKSVKDTRGMGEIVKTY